MLGGLQNVSRAELTPSFSLRHLKLSLLVKRPTPEEIKARDEEMNGHIRKITTARSAIIVELDRRHIAGDAEVKINALSQSEYDDDGPTNYISGAGVMECPVCKTGKLRYSRAGYNGHVHARCSTDGCVAWME